MIFEPETYLLNQTEALEAFLDLVTQVMSSMTFAQTEIRR